MGKLVRIGFALLVAVSCDKGDGGRGGPALQERPEIQTCLAGILEMPRFLSETFCFADLPTLAPGPDLIPYEVNSALWTDGAYKPRYMVVPPTSHITISADGPWEFPENTILIKNFGFEFTVGDPGTRRAVETRFMISREGDWEFSSYRWNDAGDEAELLSELAARTLRINDEGETREFEYVFPNQETCETCHGARPSQVLGPSTAQLNRDHDYEGLVENQLLAMAEIGIFGDAMIDPSTLPRMAAPQRDKGSLESQARAYLDVNCAHCHRPNGWAPIDNALDLRYEVPLADTGLCDPMKYFNWTGIPRVLPGDATGSGVMQRFLLEGNLRMPSIGSATIDPLGARVVADWIQRLDSCP